MLMKESLNRKVNFVHGLSKVIAKVQDNVESLDYIVIRNKKYDCTSEYLVINYKGGARTVRSCTGNSCSAIFIEISKYLNSGYYDEISYLENKLADTETFEVLEYTEADE